MAPSLRLVTSERPQPWVGPPPRWRCANCGELLRPSVYSPWGWSLESDHLCPPRVSPRLLVSAAALVAGFAISTGIAFLLLVGAFS